MGGIVPPPLWAMVLKRTATVSWHPNGPPSRHPPVYAHTPTSRVMPRARGFCEVMAAVALSPCRHVGTLTEGDTLDTLLPAMTRFLSEYARCVGRLFGVVVDGMVCTPYREPSSNGLTAFRWATGSGKFTVAATGSVTMLVAPASVRPPSHALTGACEWNGSVRTAVLDVPLPLDCRVALDKPYADVTLLLARFSCHCVCVSLLVAVPCLAHPWMCCQSSRDCPRCLCSHCFPQWRCPSCAPLCSRDSILQGPSVRAHPLLIRSSLCECMIV